MTEQEAISHVQAVVGDKYKVWKTPRWEGCEINIGPAIGWEGRNLFAPRDAGLDGLAHNRPHPWQYCLYGDTWEDAALRPDIAIGYYLFNADALLPPV